MELKKDSVNCFSEKCKQRVCEKKSVKIEY